MDSKNDFEMWKSSSDNVNLDFIHPSILFIYFVGLGRLFHSKTSRSFILKFRPEYVEDG